VVIQDRPTSIGCPKRSASRSRVTEDIVNNQTFSLLDQIEEEIGAIPFVAVFEDGCESSIKDLQIFPKSGTLSFTVAEPAVLGGRS
jgi:hypothetical protein